MLALNQKMLELNQKMLELNQKMLELNQKMLELRNRNIALSFNCRNSESYESQLRTLEDVSPRVPSALAQPYFFISPEQLFALCEGSFTP